MAQALRPCPGRERRTRACSLQLALRRSMQLRLSAARDARQFESSLSVLLKSPFVVRRNANVNPQSLAWLHFDARSPPQLTCRMHHFQVVFARRNVGHAKFAVGGGHLIPRV